MTLIEAYRKLGWAPPDVWQSGGLPARRAGRVTGATTHMLVEMCLDILECDQRHGRQIVFLVVVHSVEMREHVRRALREISTKLGLPKCDPSYFVADGHESRLRSLRGTRLRSWSVFCDHAVKTSTNDLNLWPLERVRHLKLVDDAWEARDRDGVLLGLLTHEGRDELINASTCPIEVVRDNEPPVSFPAWNLHEAQILLRSSFEL